jgi:hypothetical protein
VVLAEIAATTEHGRIDAVRRELERRSASAMSPGILPLMAGARVLHWNGKDIPEELRELPAGTYVLEAFDDALALTSEEEQGLADALASLHAGKGRTPDQVRQTIDSVLRR